MSMPGPPPVPAPDHPHPVRNHLVWSIVSLLLFWPLAIPAIINATKVNTLLAAGDRTGAERAARAAKTYATWATVAGAVVWVLGCCPLGLLVAGDPSDVASVVAHLTGNS